MVGRPRSRLATPAWHPPGFTRFHRTIHDSWVPRRTAQRKGWIPQTNIQSESRSSRFMPFPAGLSKLSIELPLLANRRRSLRATPHETLRNIGCAHLCSERHGFARTRDARCISARTLCFVTFREGWREGSAFRFARLPSHSQELSRRVTISL